MNLDTTTTRTRLRIPTEQEREQAEAHEQAIRKEWEKPIAQYQRGLLTADDLITALTEGVIRTGIAQWN